MGVSSQCPISSFIILSNYNRWLTFDIDFAHPDPTVPGAFQVGQIGKQSLEQFVRGERFFLFVKQGYWGAP